MEKCMLQKLAEARCEPNEVQVESKEKAIKAQAAKKSFIEEMMQPAALAVISVVSQRLQRLDTDPPVHKRHNKPWWQTRPGSCLFPFFSLGNLSPKFIRPNANSMQ